MAVMEKLSRLTKTILGRDHYTAAIVLAGGSGSRMGCSTTKQMMTLAGKPLIIHSALNIDGSAREMTEDAKSIYDTCSFENFK